MAVPYAQVLGWVEAFTSTVAENKEYLTRLDSAIGDADHGINMDRGMKAVHDKLEGLEGDDIGNLLKTVGMTLVSTVGGAGGPLYGTLFLQMGTATAGQAASSNRRTGLRLSTRRSRACRCEGKPSRVTRR